MTYVYCDIFWKSINSEMTEKTHSVFINSLAKKIKIPEKIKNTSEHGHRHSLLKQCCFMILPKRTRAT